MARGHLAKLQRLSPDKAVQLFAEHHIVHVRLKKNGEISQVKHAEFGWMRPQEYYGLEKFHDVLSEVLPLFGPIVDGGYRLKWALANVSVEGVPIIGLGLYGWALSRVLALGLVQTENWTDEASLLLAGVLLPFGEVLLIWAIIRNSTFQRVSWKDLWDDVAKLLKPPPPPPEAEHEQAQPRPPPSRGPPGPRPRPR